MDRIDDALAAKLDPLLPHLDERQRRLVLGAEARVLGHGGVRRVARAAGVAEGTVSRGVSELETGDAPLGRRGNSSGRPPTRPHRPNCAPASWSAASTDFGHA